MSPGCCALGAGGDTLLRVIEGGLGFGAVTLPDLLVGPDQVLSPEDQGWGREARGARGPQLTFDLPRSHLFNECSSDSLVLKFRALRCSTEVYECLKTALRSPK